MPPQLLLDAFAALDDAHLAWALLRGHDELDPPRGDVDLLVHPDQAARAQRALIEAGFAPRRSWARGTQRSLLGYDEHDAVWLELHLVSAVGAGPWYEFELPLAGELVTHADRGPHAPKLREGDEFWVTLLHVLLDKGRVDAGQRATLVDHLDAAATSPLAASLDQLVPGVTDELCELVAGGRWEELVASGTRLADAWESADASVRTRRARHRTSMFARKLVEPVTRRGVTVAVLAPDGAGKSTLIDRLEDRLYFPVRVAYLGLEGGRFADTSRSRVPGLGFVRRVAAMWSAYVAARYHVARRRFVLFDRYPYDARLDDARPRAGIARVRRALLGRSLPSPDLVLVLDAPPEVLRERKPEHPIERLAVHVRAYRQLAHAVEATVLDATRDIEQVTRDAIAAIWHTYRDRLVA